MIAVVIVTGACLIGSVILAAKLRQWDRQDADARAVAVIDDAERIVRMAESRRQHPSQWHREP